MLFTATTFLPATLNLGSIALIISNPVASELSGRGGLIGFVNTDQRSRLTRPYKNYDDTIPNQMEMIS
jgi:hypothetical protein